MKLLVAVIQPQKLHIVREALARIEVTRLSISDAFTYGNMALHNSLEKKMNLLRKVVLEIAVNEDFVEPTIECIRQVARTGPDGSDEDGKVFVMPLDRAVRIGEMAEGPGAIN